MTTHKQVHSTEEALELALKALERMKSYGNVFAHHRYEKNPYEQVCEAISFIDEALAQRKPLTDELWDLLDAVEKELNRRAIPEAWLLVAHKAGRAYIEARGIKE